MSEDGEKSLWFDEAGARYFLIPDEVELGEGTLELRTSLGRRRLVSEAAVLPFEVDRQEATAWSSEQLGKILGGAGKARRSGPVAPSAGRPKTEEKLRSFAGLAGTLARAAERAGAKLGVAADELRAKRQAAEAEAARGPMAEPGEAPSEDPRPKEEAARSGRADEET